MPKGYNLTNQEYLDLYGELGPERINKLLEIEKEHRNHECEESDFDCEHCYNIERQLDEIEYLINEFDENDMVELQKMCYSPDIAGIQDELSAKVDEIMDNISYLISEIRKQL